MFGKRAVLAAAAVTMAGSGMLATAGPASAGTAPSPAGKGAQPKAAYNGACGSGYSVVNSAAIGDAGTVFLTYNATSGKNCVVTVQNHPGTAKHMVASVKMLMEGERLKPAEDSGNYTHYAGPVYVHAKEYCVAWRGAIENDEYANPGSNCQKTKP